MVVRVARPPTGQKSETPRRCVIPLEGLVLPSAARCEACSTDERSLCPDARFSASLPLRDCGPRTSAMPSLMAPFRRKSPSITVLSKFARIGTTKPYSRIDAQMRSTSAVILARVSDVAYQLRYRPIDDLKLRLNPHTILPFRSIHPSIAIWDFSRQQTSLRVEFSGFARSSKSGGAANSECCEDCENADEESRLPVLSREGYEGLSWNSSQSQRGARGLL
jgi:hypothetical protein